MAEESIRIKIQALVDGLNQVAELSRILGNLGSSAVSQAASLKNISNEIDHVGAVSAAAKQGLDGLGKMFDYVLGSSSKISPSLSSASSGLGSLSESARNSWVAINGVATSTLGAGRGLEDLGANSRNGANALNEFDNSSRRSGEGAREFARGSDAGSTALSKLVAYLKQAALAYAAYFAAQSVSDVTQYAARTETLGVTLDIVAKNAGYTAEQIRGYEKELKKLGITTQAARESMTSMIQASIPLEKQSGESAANISRLARAAQDLAVVTGENSSQTLSRLTRNIQQMDTMGLRWMGLTVDMSDAQQRFAQSIGVSADALTKQQKMMAVNNAVLVEAAKLSGAYEASMDTAGKKAASLARYQEELANSLGNKLLPAYGAVIDGATQLLKGLTESADAFDKNGEMAKALGRDLTSLIDSVNSIILSFAKLGSDSSGSLSSIASNIIGIVRDLASLVAASQDAAGGMSYLSFVLGAIALGVAGLRDGFTLLTIVLADVNSKFLKFGSGVASVASLLAGDIGFKDFANRIKGLSDEMDRAADAQDKFAGDTAAKFAAGDNAVQRFINGVKGADSALSSFGKDSSLKGVTDDLNKLSDQTIRQSMSSDDLAKATDIVISGVNKLATSGTQTASTIEDMTARLKELGLEGPKNVYSLEQAQADAAKGAKNLLDDLDNLSTNVTFEGLRDQLNALMRAQAAGTISAADQSTAISALQARMIQLKSTTELTGTQQGELEKAFRSVDSFIGSTFNKSLEDMGVTVSQLESSVTPKVDQIATSIETIASSSASSATVFREAFSEGLDSAKSIADLARLSEGIELATQTAERFKDRGSNLDASKWIAASADASDRARLKFNELFESSLKSLNTNADFERMSEAVRRFAEVTGQSSEFIESKMQSIALAQQNAAERIAQAGIADSLAIIGITAEEMSGKTSKATEQVVLELDKLAKSASVSAEQYSKVFDKGLNLQKTITDLAEFGAMLKKQVSEGSISWQEYTVQIDKVNRKFEELFKSSLKAADTDEKYKDLRREVDEFGKSSERSGATASRAMVDLSEKITNTSSTMLSLSSKEKDLSAQRVSLARAEAQVMEDGLRVQDAKHRLGQAILADQRQSTPLTRAEVDAARAALVAAQAKLEASNAQVVLERGMVELKQAQINLEVASIQLAAANTEQTRAAVAAASAHVTQVQLGVDKLAEQANRASEVAVRTQSAAAAAAAYARNVAAASETIKNQNYNYQGPDFQGIAQSGRASLLQAGYSADTANAVSPDFSMAEIKRFWDDLYGGLTSSNQLFNESGNIIARNQREIASLVKAMEESTTSLNNAQQGWSDLNSEIALYQAGIGDMPKSSAEVRKSLREMDLSLEGMKEAYNQLRIAAAQSIKSAEDAIKSFLSTSDSIHEELLSAMGDEEGAIKARYEARKKDLDLQYQQLQIQIQISKVQAQSVGLSTAGLDEAAAQAAAAYERSKVELAQLEEIALQNQASVRQEEAARQEADRKAAIEEANSAKSDAEETKKKSAEELAAQRKADAERVEEERKARVEAQNQKREELANRRAGTDKEKDSSGREVRTYTTTTVPGIDRTNSLLENILNVIQSIAGRSGGVYARQATDVAASVPGQFASLGTPTIRNAVDSSTQTRPVTEQRVVLQLGSKTATVYTDDSSAGELIDILSELKNRSGV